MVELIKITKFKINLIILTVNLIILRLIKVDYIKVLIIEFNKINILYNIKNIHIVESIHMKIRIINQTSMVFLSLQAILKINYNIFK